MHYKHRLGKRAAQHAPFGAAGAAAVERLGVRATYRLHDRVLSNPPSRKLFESHRPQLDDSQREIVDQLRSEGLCVVPFAKLFSEELWQELAADATAFTREMERRLAGNVVEADPCRSVVLAAARSGRRPYRLDELASRLQRPVSGQGVLLPLRRRRARDHSSTCLGARGRARTWTSGRGGR